MKSKNLPLPRRGRGAGGWGKEIKLKAGQAGGKEGKPPCGFRNGKVSRRQRRQAPPADTTAARSAGTKKASRPCGHHSGKVSRRPAGQAPQRAPAPQVQPVPPPAQARGCKGRSPLHMKSKNPPSPEGKGGGGMGAGNKAKGRVGRRQGRQAAPADSGTARSAGDKAGKPPCGHHSGKVSRQPAGQAPKNHSSASSSRKAVTKPRAAASSDASAKIRRRGSVPENRQITKELSAK